MSAPGTCRPGCPCGAADPEPRCVDCGEPRYWGREHDRCPDCRVRYAASVLNSVTPDPDVDPVEWVHSPEAGEYCDACGLSTGAPCLAAGGGASGGWAMCLACAEKAVADV